MLVMFRDYHQLDKVWWRAEFTSDQSNYLPRVGETVIWAVEDMRFEVMEVRHVFDFSADAMHLVEPRADQGVIQVVLRKIPSPKRHF